MISLALSRGDRHSNQGFLGFGPRRSTSTPSPVSTLGCSQYQILEEGELTPLDTPGSYSNRKGKNPFQFCVAIRKAQKHGKKLKPLHCAMQSGGSKYTSIHHNLLTIEPEFPFLQFSSLHKLNPDPFILFPVTENHASFFCC